MQLQTDTPELTPGMWILADVLCGVDGSRRAEEAVRQAAALAALAGPDGQLALLAITGAHPTAVASQHAAALGPARARRALAHAARLAARAGVAARSDLDERPDVAEVLLERAAGHGLLAIGPPSMPRLAHLLLGGTATAAAHHLPCSLLIAREPPADARFGARIAVASDAQEGSDELVAFATGLACALGGSLTLLHALHSESARRPARVASQARYAAQALGDRATALIEAGRPRELLIAAAATQRCSLLVLAGRRHGGLGALGSVSERLVHEAPCSVLVMRPEDLGHALGER